MGDGSGGRSLPFLSAKWLTPNMYFRTGICPRISLLCVYYKEILIIGFSPKPHLNLDLLLQHRSPVKSSLKFPLLLNTEATLRT